MYDNEGNPADFDGDIEIIEITENKEETEPNYDQEQIIFTELTAEEGKQYRATGYGMDEENMTFWDEVSCAIDDKTKETQINLDSQYLNEYSKSQDDPNIIENNSWREIDPISINAQENSEMLFNNREKIDLIGDVLKEIGENTCITHNGITSKIESGKLKKIEETSAENSIFTEPLSLEIRDSVVENKNNSQSIGELSEEESVVEVNSFAENSSYIENDRIEKITEMLNIVSLDQDELRPEEIKELCLTFSKKMKFKYTVEDYKTMAPIFKKQLLTINFRNRSHILQEFCKRWWYVLPEWPPRDYDYSEKLKNLKLREVPVEQWMETPDFSKEASEKKVLKVKNYPGIFEDAKGQLYDLRPQETCPSIRNFSKIDPIQLMNLLMEAYSSQLAELNSLETYEIEDEKIHRDKLMLYEYLLNKLTKTLEDPPKEFVLI